MAVFIGNDENNVFRGTEDRDTALGGKGNDTLLGVGNDDTLFGQQGRDVLRGDAGTNYLVPGPGQDRLIATVDVEANFVFQEPTDLSVGVFMIPRFRPDGAVSFEPVRTPLRDTIFGFASGTDKINIEGIDADPTTEIDDDFDFVGFTSNPADGEVSFYQPFGFVESFNTFVALDPVGSVEGEAFDGDFEIELIGLHTLAPDDFVQV